MALPYSHTLTVDVWRGRNNFLKQDDPSFAQDQRVTLSFGANTAAAPAEIYGPWPRNYLLQFFPFLRSPLLFQRPAGVTDAVWATMTVPENFDGAEHQFKPDVFSKLYLWHSLLPKYFIHTSVYMNIYIYMH